MRKKPLVFDAIVKRRGYDSDKAWGSLYALRLRTVAHLVNLDPQECSAPAIPRALLAGLKTGDSHRVRITVERIDD